MGNGAGKQARLLIARTITPTHFGIGRAPGAVDLPIARDHMGYPIAPASGIKGALKQYCARKKKCGIANEGEQKGRIICMKKENGKSTACPCCCLFGPEPGDSTAGAGAISITDLTLLAIPVPSHNLGWVYVTTPYLLQRVADLATYLGLENMSNALNALAGATKTDKDTSTAVYIGDVKDPIKIPGLIYEHVKSFKDVKEISKTLELFISGGLSDELPNKLLVVPEVDGKLAVDRGIIRYWRVGLDYEKKTVAAGPWNEEYVPADAVFVGAVIDNGWRNTYCQYIGNGDVNPVKEFSKIFNRKAILVGGKSTVGKGIVNLKLVPESEED